MKLGGSVLTRKDEPFSLRLGVVERLAAEIAGALDAGARLVGIVLGGGSYGHYAAHEARGASTAEALSLVSSAMLELAQAVADALMAAGVWSLILPPHAFCRPRGLVPGCDWRPAREALGAGVLPLVYGDVYPCPRGWCIVSGDELLVEMACSLGAQSAVYVTSVDGVYVDGRLAERLRLGEQPLLDGAGSTPRGYDVTGGMARKLEVLRANRCPGLKRVWIVNGLAPGRLRALLLGEPVTATEVVLG